ncbi:hypothetical protein [Vibrio harveyi]|uniref:hypothetical protein n=1 Tax=Vibrio harveyi TaxID=669 RepID=UPI003BB6C0DB
MMSEVDHITYNEVEFLIPAYRFNIRFSYVTQKALPFIREFILRLVHLGELEPISISEYFGLSEREVREALRDLIERGDLKYTEQGRLKLTEQAKKYFSEYGGALKVTDLASTGVVLGFESTAFNCVSSHTERLDNDWSFGFRLDVPSENIAKRERLANQAFQRQFSQLVEEKYLDNIKSTSALGRLRIYKLDSIRQVAQGPFRIKLSFKMDEFGRAIEREDLEQLKNSSTADELITNAIHQNTGINNIHEILGACEILGDTKTKDFITERGIDVSGLKEFSNQNLGKESDFIPFIGALYTEGNWKLLESQFKRIRDKLARNHQDGTKELSWLFPSTALWGKSSELSTRLQQIIDQRKTSGKKAKALYKPAFFAPVSGPDARGERNHWKNELSSYLDYTNNYVEGLLGGSVETLCIENELAVVVYHINLPDVYPVSVPLGFMTCEPRLVNRISDGVKEYLDEVVDGEYRKNLGTIK